MQTAWLQIFTIKKYLQKNHHETVLEDGKLYLQVYLDDALYELNV